MSAPTRAAPDAVLISVLVCKTTVVLVCLVCALEQLPSVRFMFCFLQQDLFDLV